MVKKVILAPNYRSAQSYAFCRGWQKNEWFYPIIPESLLGFDYIDVYRLPGFKRMKDINEIEHNFYRMRGVNITTIFDVREILESPSNWRYCWHDDGGFYQGHRESNSIGWDRV